MNPARLPRRNYEQKDTGQSFEVSLAVTRVGNLLEKMKRDPL